MVSIKFKSGDFELAIGSHKPFYSWDISKQFHLCIWGHWHVGTLITHNQIYCINFETFLTINWCINVVKQRCNFFRRRAFLFNRWIQREGNILNLYFWQVLSADGANLVGTISKQGTRFAITWCELSFIPCYDLS